MIAEDAIRAVRERASLVEVVSDLVALRRRGRSALGLCPFHAEKTPSFTVSEERGFYHCFGCGEHGDVFAFVMKTESLAFPEAVRRVAERFGVPLPEAAADTRRTAEPLAAVNALAAAFFRAELTAAAGARARAYLRERGLGDEIVDRFGLGYAPGTGQALAQHLRARGVRIDDAVAAGLLVRRDAPAGVYDRFRDRIVFPISDPSGRVIAFGGRVLPGRPSTGDPPPKYLNSSESPIFRKGQTLYGLPQAREAIRRSGRALVVEGYLDVIALAQAGIAEVVAPLGTALTVEQLRLLRQRFTDDVIACFDGDAAGRRAAARSFPLFLEAGLWGRGVFLPAGEDPDSFVRGQGRTAFEGYLARAEPLVDAYVADLAGADPSAIGRRVDAAREVMKLLKRVHDPIEHELFVRLAADRLGVREEMLRADAVVQVADAPPAAATDRAPDVEERLVGLMAADPATARRVAAEDVIGHFADPRWKRAAEMLADAPAGDLSRVLDDLPGELKDRVVRRVFAETADEHRDQLVAECIAFIRDRREQRHLLEEIRAADARGDTDALRAAWARLQTLRTGTHTEKVPT
jgi:DNA primase